MTSDDEFVVDIEGYDNGVMLVAVTTPAGRFEILGTISIVGRMLRVERAHVDGPGPGVFGRAGLNAIGRKLLEESDVDEIVIEGSARSTGRNKGRIPKPVRLRRR